MKETQDHHLKCIFFTAACDSSSYFLPLYFFRSEFFSPE